MFNSNRQTNLSSTDRQCKALMLTVIIVGVLSFLLCLGTAANAQSSNTASSAQTATERLMTRITELEAAL